jgi:hypothetical protein
MNQNIKDVRILSIAPSTRGFGFAVIEDQKLINWGGKKVNVNGDENKNKESLKKIDSLIHQWQPAVITIEDANTKDSRRRSRIKELVPQITALAKSLKVKVKLISRSQVKRVFFDGKGTKYDLAKLLAEWYPEELANRLPRKRKLWELRASPSHFCRAKKYTGGMNIMHRYIIVFPIDTISLLQKHCQFRANA